MLPKAEKQVVELQQKVSEQQAIILAYEVDAVPHRSQQEAGAALTKVRILSCAFSGDRCRCQGGVYHPL